MKPSRGVARAGVKKVTISLRESELDIMARFARTRHRGNLSGAFAELVQHVARLQAMDRVLAELPEPSERGLAQLEEELLHPRRRPSSRGSKKPKKIAA